MKSVNSDNDFVCYGALRIAICDILYLGCRKYYKNMSLAKNYANIQSCIRKSYFRWWYADVLRCDGWRHAKIVLSFLFLPFPCGLT